MFCLSDKKNLHFQFVFHLLSVQNNFCSDHLHFNDKHLPKNKGSGTIFSEDYEHDRTLSNDMVFLPKPFCSLLSCPSFKTFWLHFNYFQWSTEERMKFCAPKELKQMILKKKNHIFSLSFLWRGVLWLVWQQNLPFALSTLEACVLESTCKTCWKSPLINHKLFNAYCLHHWQILWKSYTRYVSYLCDSHASTQSLGQDLNRQAHNHGLYLTKNVHSGNIQLWDCCL